MSNTSFLPQVMQAQLEVKRAELRLRTALEMLGVSQENRPGVIETIEAALQKTIVLGGNLYEAVNEVKRPRNEQNMHERGGKS